MTKAFLCSDAAVGETRRCLVDRQGRPFRLEIERWSEQGKRIRLSERRWGRATARVPGGSGWFVDLGLGEKAILRVAGRDATTEGIMLPVVIAAEPHDDKGPRVKLDADADDPRLQRATEPGLRGPPLADPFLEGLEIVGRTDGPKARAVIDAAIEEALQVTVPLPGGGDIAIERTRALTAIDIDAGGNPIAKSFADFNKAAAAEIGRQIALRGLAGIVVVDFINMTLKEDRSRVLDSFRSALVDHGVEFIKVGGMSQAGLCEATLPRRRRPLADAIHARGGEREALDALRAIETAAVSVPGKRIRARIAAAAEAWLASGAIEWEPALADRIGRRWTIETGVEPRGPSAEVWAES